MRRIGVILYLLGAFTMANAQLNDAQWLIGNGPTGILDFRLTTPGVDTLSGFTPTFLTVANICDESGDLLF